MLRLSWQNAMPTELDLQQHVYNNVGSRPGVFYAALSGPAAPGLKDLDSFLP